MQEQSKSEDREYHNHLSAYTNVWAIGATMYELMTLYRVYDCLQDPDFHDNGVITYWDTNKKPDDYSKNLKHLIKQCITPNPEQRISLDRLRSLIEVNRDQMHGVYDASDDAAKATFEADNRVYYVGNDINNMPPGGDWSPVTVVSPSQPEDVPFPDPDFPIVFPRFAPRDGPESDVEDGNTDANSEENALKETLLDDGAVEEGSDDDSVPMDIEDEEPVSPPPAPAPVAPVAPVAPPPPPPAPAQAPPVALSQRKLRSGRVVNYF